MKGDEFTRLLLAFLALAVCFNLTVKSCTLERHEEQIKTLEQELKELKSKKS